MYDVFRDNLPYRYKGGFIPWTDKLRTLVEANRLYQNWLKENPPAEDIQFGNVPSNIEELLNSITCITLNLVDNFEHWDLFPGLDFQDYYFDDTSIARITFDNTIDLDMISNNTSGIPIDMIEKLIPQCKFMSAYIELPIELTPEELQQRNQDNNGVNVLYYIRWETFFRIADIPLYNSSSALFQLAKS